MKTHLSLALFSCLASMHLLAMAQPLEISGSTTVQKRLIEPHAAAVRAATGIEMKIYGVGSGKGMIALAEKQVPLAAVSESLEEALASARKAAEADGKPFKDPGDLRFHPVLQDTIVVVVHRDNPVGTLSREQVKGIHTGTIRNWKELGGPDLPVKVVTGAPGSATRALLQSQVMDKQAYAPGTAEMRTTLEEIKVVGLSRGAVGAMSENVARAAADKVKVVSGVQIRRPLAFVSIGAPAPAAQKVIDFFKSKEGQKLVQQ